MFMNKIAFSLPERACSCVRTKRVLSVLPTKEELHLGQVNLYTTLDLLLNTGALSLVLVKRYTFVVFSRIYFSSYILTYTYISTIRIF